MKRFHVHVSVANIEQSVGFYSALFNAPPSVHHADYAKWMMDEPAVNFAISSHRAVHGVDHLGFQVDSAQELDALTQRLEQAGMAIQDKGAATCCYAHSDKGWVHDPQGLAWESFVTHGSATTYGSQSTSTLTASAPAAACCGPAPAAPLAKTACNTGCGV